MLASILGGKGREKPTINVGRCQNKQSTTSWALANSGKQRRKQVRQDHSQTSLHILQSGILSPPTAVDLETRLEIGDNTKEVRQGGYNGIEVEVNVVGSDIRGERLGSLSCFLA